MKPLYISTSFNFKCRFDAIYKKYDKYDVKKQRDLIISGDDAFVRLYATVHIETTLQVMHIQICIDSFRYLGFLIYCFNKLITL
ncbi:hypothetical protein HanPI659440_Chr03g0111681 [Helianthus annuus]|nr:hypothetical protein HanPI659440_Chr03g0111681 [Helianthus annuus]